VRRVGDYAFAKPAREILFTVVSREEKYKAKNLSTQRSRAGRCGDRMDRERGESAGYHSRADGMGLVPLALLWGWVGGSWPARGEVGS